MSALVGPNNCVERLHDHDYIHNGKKLVNHLDRPMKVLQLSVDLLTCEHIGLVYNRFSFDEHGLWAEDVQDTDHQNWALAQRLCK